MSGGPGSPARAGEARQHADASVHRRAAVVGRELGMIAVAALAYIGIRAVTEGRTAIAEANGYALHRLEEGLGIAWEAWLQSLVIGRESLVDVANWIYIWGHWPVIATVAAVLFLARRDRYYLLRNAIFISGALGFLFFAFLPMAPPRLLELGLVDTVAEQSNAYRALQPPSLTNQYAALPSLHFGWNLLVGIVLVSATTRWAIRVFAVAMPAAMGFAVIATANHFVLDVVVGAVLVLAAIAAADRLQPAGATLRPGGFQAEPVHDRAPGG